MFSCWKVNINFSIVYMKIMLEYNFIITPLPSSQTPKRSSVYRYTAACARTLVAINSVVIIIVIARIL